MLPLPPSIHNDASNWEYPVIPPTTPVASHMPMQVLQQELRPTTQFSQPELPPTTPVASQHVTTPLSQQQLSPLMPTTPVAPQHVPSHDLHFTPSFLASIRASSCSRQKFAINLVWSLFSLDERKVSNVTGAFGKRKLDLQMISRIKEATFQMYPLETGETMLGAWTVCIKSVDESCCRLNCTPKGRENWTFTYIFIVYCMHAHCKYTDCNLSFNILFHNLYIPVTYATWALQYSVLVLDKAAAPWKGFKYQLLHEVL